MKPMQTTTAPTANTANTHRPYALWAPLDAPHRPGTSPRCQGVSAGTPPAPRPHPPRGISHTAETRAATMSRTKLGWGRHPTLVALVAAATPPPATATDHTLGEAWVKASSSLRSDSQEGTDTKRRTRAHTPPTTCTADSPESRGRARAAEERGRPQAAGSPQSRRRRHTRARAHTHQQTSRDRACS